MLAACDCDVTWLAEVHARTDPNSDMNIGDDYVLDENVQLPFDCYVKKIEISCENANIGPSQRTNIDMHAGSTALGQI